MATRKPKKVLNEDDIFLATDAKSSHKLKNVESGGWPKMNQGTHLTVKTFEDGSTELIWDDEQLLREVRNAILKHESTIPVETKK